MLLQDLRYALRMLAKQPAFTAIVIITFALGIGANTAVFSVLNAVLLRPLPFHEPDRIVGLLPYDMRSGAEGVNDKSTCSYPDFIDWRAQNQVFERVAVYTHQSLTLTDGKEATHIQGGLVSADLFPTLGVRPLLGRVFLPNEDEPGIRVVVLSYGLWQRRFGGDPTIVGRSLLLDGEQFQVVGVMPAGFSFPITPLGPELWTSLSILREAKGGAQPMTEQRGNDFLQCIARLRSDESINQAQANIDTIGTDLRRKYPDSNTNVAVKVLPLVNAMVAEAHTGLLMLCGMAGCVLLIACVNVASLLLARSLSRQKEVSIRAALGAGRWQIVKQLLTESTLLGAFGGLTGLLVAIWGLDSLKALLPADIPRIDQLSPDLRVLLFTAVVSLGIGALAGLLPAWRASHPNLAGSLSETSRGSTEGARGKRTRSALVIVEIILSLILLASAGLLLESFLRLQKVRPGFDPANVMTARIALPDANYGKPEKAAEFYKTLLARVLTLPGVNSAAATWWIPLSGSEIVFNFNIEERPLPKSQQPIAQVDAVTNDYFKAMRVPLLRGRDFAERDDRNATPVAIVSESFAKEFFPGEDPVGKRITPNGSVDPGDPPIREIVGVVADTHLISLGAAPKPQIYLPHQQFAVQSMAIFVRTQNNPQLLTAALRDAVSEIDKDVPVYRPRALTDYLSQSIAQPRLHATLVGLFALIALLLAAAGIFGMMSYAVTQRTQEIGIRLALGAQRGDVLRMILSEGMRLVAFGVVTGVAAVFLMGRLLRSMLYGVAATDPPTIFGVAILLAVVALIACWWPARRASAVDPVIALRSE
jgi:putative ABC transport system permease protein